MQTKRSWLIGVLAVLTIVAAGWAQQAGANDPNDKDKDKDQANPDPQQGGMVFQVVNGPGIQIRRGPGMMGMFGGDELSRVISTLGELNLSPTFKLSDDQKTKIQSIRDDFKRATEAWRKEHADELKQLDDREKELFENMQNNGPPDPNDMMELMNQRNELMQSAPNGEDHAKQVMDVLTPDQQKSLEAKQAEEDKEREEAMQHRPMRFGPGRGPGGGPGGPPPGHDDHDKKDGAKDGAKDGDKKDDKGR